MNKLLISLIAIISMTDLICSKAMATASPYNGIYFGAEAGAVLSYFSGTSDTTVTVNGRSFRPPLPSIPSFSLDVPVNSSVSDLSGFAGGHIGVGHVYNRVYLGLEANGDFGSVNTTNYAAPSNQADDLAASIKDDTTIKNNYGFTLRPGYLLTQSLLLYAQLGVEKAQIDTTTTTTFANSLALNGGPTYSIASKSSDNQLGYRLGLGIEEHATQHLSVRVEYLFTDFGSVSSDNSIPINNPLLLPSSAVSQSAQYSPYMHSVMLGVSYYV